MCCCCCCCCQDGDFHIARISVQEDVAKQMTDNDLLLLTKDHPQDENCRCTLPADPWHAPPTKLGQLPSMLLEWHTPCGWPHVLLATVD